MTWVYVPSTGSHCVPGPAVSNSACNSPGPSCEWSATWKPGRSPATSSAPECATVAWTTLPSGTTSVPSTPSPGVESWIRSLQDTRARVSAPPLVAGTSSPTSPERSCESSTDAGHRLSSSRTSSRRDATSPGSENSSTVWDTVVRLCSKREPPTWVPRTKGNGYSYLPTPTATANQTASSMMKWPACRLLMHLFGNITPRLYEWLMGWPEGWTDSPPVGTAWSRWLQRMRTELSRLLSP